MRDVISEELVVSRPCGTSLVYLADHLVYLYLVNLSIKKSIPLVYSYLVNLSTKKVKSKVAVQNTYALLI
jgi:hypothetical protein